MNTIQLIQPDEDTKNANNEIRRHLTFCRWEDAKSLSHQQLSKLHKKISCGGKPTKAIKSAIGHFTYYVCICHYFRSYHNTRLISFNAYMPLWADSLSQTSLSQSIPFFTESYGEYFGNSYGNYILKAGTTDCWEKFPEEKREPLYTRAMSMENTAFKLKELLHQSDTPFDSHPILEAAEELLRAKRKIDELEAELEPHQTKQG
ncbi:hypothetical protein HBA55_35060 [Pseudomaricurvus alkylphenolicus]|uniref:hypothetical protein n=1 Tax=Pseudomaricurvus alkylphenolicus TaxID=1306991 RepID=UPI00141DEC62|nr:hypothetical protein [Pseudomaricurvus alkylphenolicus]NIB44854.1 hypothetical protein [Pseudomaricurvus alkylphenolicus]